MFSKSKSTDKMLSVIGKIFKRDMKSNNFSENGNSKNNEEENVDNNNNINSNNGKMSTSTSLDSHIGDSTNLNSKDTKDDSNKAQCQHIRVNRLMKELADLQRKQKNKNIHPVFTVELLEDKLDEWCIKVAMSSIDSSSELYADMKKFNIPHIILHIVFPPLFPFSPPFLRVVSPNIEKGFVMEGGALCLELLTPRGWSSAYSIESIIMQFTASVVKGHGRVSKTLSKSKSFSKKTAEETFRDLVRTHERFGWVTPPLAEG